MVRVTLPFESGDDALHPASAETATTAAAPIASERRSERLDLNDPAADFNAENTSVTPLYERNKHCWCANDRKL
jgi:hypothetical protein